MSSLSDLVPAGVITGDDVLTLFDHARTNGYAIPGMSLVMVTQLQENPDDDRRYELVEESWLRQRPLVFRPLLIHLFIHSLTPLGLLDLFQPSTVPGTFWLATMTINRHQANPDDSRRSEGTLRCILPLFSNILSIAHPLLFW